MWTTASIKEIRHVTAAFMHNSEGGQRLKKKKRDVKKQNIQETDDFIIQHTILNKHVKSKDGDVQFYSSASEPAVPL